MLARTPPHPLLRKSARATRGAFTLLEVMIVMAIIVMLAGVGGYYLFTQYESAKAGRAKVDCQTLAELAGTYKLHNDGPPPNIEALAAQQPNGGDPLAPAD